CQACLSQGYVLGQDRGRVVPGVKRVGELAQIVHQRMRGARHGRLFEDLGKARELTRDRLLVRAVEQRQVARGKLCIVAERARGELLHDAGDARVRVLDVVDGILVAARASQRQIEVQVLV